MDKLHKKPCASIKENVLESGISIAGPSPFSKNGNMALAR